MPAPVFRCCLLAVVMAGGLGFPQLWGSPPETPSLTRTEELRLRRLAKAAELKPEQPGGLEKALLYIESKRPEEIFSVRYKDFYPRFGNLSPGSGFAPGLRFYKSRIGGSPLTLESSVANSFRDYRVADLQFGSFNKLAPDFFIGPPEFGTPFEFGAPRVQQVDRARWFTYGEFRYRFFPQEDFYGAGPDSRPGNRTSFQQEDFASDVVVGYQFAPWLASGVRAGYRRYNIEPGTDRRFPTTEELFDDVDAPGLARQPDFLMLNWGLFLNYTDTPGNPHSGGVFGISVSRFDERGGAEFDFTRLSVDTRHYLPLGSRQRVLALRFLGSFDDPGSFGRVPFFLQNTLGGASALRGWPEFRFRDANAVYFSGEYRWEPAPAFEIALFYDVGKVYPAGQSFRWERFQKSAGIGFRFKTARKVLMRFDIGRSREGTRLQFRFGPAF